jgi:serine/threonine-protein kinase SRPK3
LASIRYSVSIPSIFSLDSGPDYNRKARHVALKINTADASNSKTPTFELNILEKFSIHQESHPGTEHVLSLIDQFKHHGPNGEHVCLVFKAMGPDLAKYRRLYPGLKVPVPVMKRISKQLLLALSFLHESNKVIHTGELIYSSYTCCWTLTHRS